MTILRGVFVRQLLSLVLITTGYGGVANAQTFADPACDAQLDISWKAIQWENACVSSTSDSGVEICFESCLDAVAAAYNMCKGKWYTTDDGQPAVFTLEPFVWGLVQLIPDGSICETTIIEDFINIIIKEDEMTCQDWLGMSLVTAVLICDNGDADDNGDDDWVVPCPLACTTIIDGVYNACDATFEYIDPNDETNILSASELEEQANYFRGQACNEYAEDQSSSWPDFSAADGGAAAETDDDDDGLDDDTTTFETPTTWGDAACDAALNSAMAAVYGGGCETVTNDNGEVGCDPHCLELLLAGHVACMGQNYTTSSEVIAYHPTDLVLLLLYEATSDWLCNQPVISDFLQQIKKDLTCNDWLTLSSDSVSGRTYVSLCDDDYENFGSSCPVGCVAIIDGVYDTCSATSVLYRADTGRSWSAAAVELIANTGRGPLCQNYTTSTKTLLWPDDNDNSNVLVSGDISTLAPAVVNVVSPTTTTVPAAKNTKKMPVQSEPTVASSPAVAPKPSIITAPSTKSPILTIGGGAGGGTVPKISLLTDSSSTNKSGPCRTGLVIHLMMILTMIFL